MTLVESKFDSDVFGYRIAKLKIEDAKEAEQLPGRKAAKKLWLFQAVFVKTESWIYPAAGAVALDHRYEMEKDGRSPAGAEVKNSTVKPEHERLAATAFLESRFSRDPKLAAKAPELYVNWLKLPGNCWVLPGLEGDAFLLQTWDDPYTARISLIAVHPKAQRLGLGRKLLYGVLGQVAARTWRVCVSACNLRALRLYESSGFRVSSASTIYHIWT